MIFFKKRMPLKKSEDSYYRYRDSVTGHMNRDFLFKEYERLKRLDNYSAVMVRLAGCEDMVYAEASRKIREAGEIITRIFSGNVSRLENGDFILFSDEAEKIAEKLSFFLKELSEKGEVYAVCSDKLDKNESFDIFIRRIKRHIGVEESNNMTQML